ncbi:MmcQ/YjbR family DNA-binding protein [Fusibacter ferrireducens]|uniref:MmcQ/YjbR family DNA-binding protein n=1 Tax=Fusibacter ferrireducens TaxID=2785058 RepID=A0ABR9ZNC6_9FIRM|nr:MmcQ/YjbR family DNA-binding protein [Fusibacter ferrireducens]MBF4691914.1 MmcQ/YjbR family DNA-binding protein [Fusibacter ferrireducens]
MQYSGLHNYCKSKKGCQHEFKTEWGVDRYMLSGKMFAMIGGDKAGKPIITLKGSPMENLALRENFSDIIPGYYMNKEHWNSIYLEGHVPDDLIKKMIDASYHLVFSGLSKKLQKEIETSS